MRFPPRPRFYDLTTADGVPYSHIATLHGRDVLATTVLQTCIRYQSRTKTCQFCAIGQSLAAGRTIERKTPAQLAEVAKAAVELDGVKHMVMTTGTPRGRDRGAAILCESATAVKNAVYLPIQAQCEPPDDDELVRAAEERRASTALGMHIEVVTPELRRRMMPGKSEIPVERYLAAFAAATPVFGRGQVSTYILAGLGDSAETILDLCAKLVALGVYPFVVPFVPISGTPLESHPAPGADFMHSVLKPLSHMLVEAGLKADRHQGGLRQMRRLLVALHLRKERSRHDASNPFAPFSPSEFRVKFAASRWEREGAYALRRTVFCEEQGLFGDDDRDAVDDYAITIVALSMLGVAADQVVGTVRIHEEAPGRLAAARGSRSTREFRRVGAIGATLIRLAVVRRTRWARATFLAHVQAQNGPLFHQMHWETLDEVELHGRPHLKMRADLAFYPPCTAPGSRLCRVEESGLRWTAPSSSGWRTSLRASAGVAAKADIGVVAERLGLAGAAIRVGDDCAAIPDGDGHLLFAIEGFINEFVAADPWFAGWCGVMVNLSDIAAMGGRPIAVVDAIWADGEACARPVLDGLQGGGARPMACRSSAATPICATPQGQLAVAVLGRAGPRLLTSFDAQPGRRARARRRPSRRLSRAVRQFPGRARRAVRSGCAAISPCSPRSPSAASRAPPRTSARAACPARRSCSRKAPASRSISISTRSSPPPGRRARTLAEDVSELRLSALGRAGDARGLAGAVSSARPARRRHRRRPRGLARSRCVSGERRALLRDHAAERLLGLGTARAHEPAAAHRHARPFDAAARRRRPCDEPLRGADGARRRGRAARARTPAARGFFRALRLRDARRFRSRPRRATSTRHGRAPHRRLSSTGFAATRTAASTSITRMTAFPATRWRR